MRPPEIETALDEIENKNYSAALRLLARLAEAGSPDAICNLATLYQCGLGVEMDGKRAVALYEQVARLNIRERHLSGIAFHNLATIYITGLAGIEPNPQKAEEYGERARQLGFAM
jgi:TPR repeat protein